MKLLALEALESGLQRNEAADLVGVTVTSLDDWRKQYGEGGVEGLRSRPLPLPRPRRRLRARP